MRRFLLVLGFGVCVGSAFAALEKWNQRMQELSATLSEMLPDLMATQNSADSTKRLKKNAEKLSKLVHSLKVNPGKESLLPPDADPSLTMISDMFTGEVQRAALALEVGQVDYAKGILRNASNYCIACHSRNDQGPDFPGITLSPKTDKLSNFERADLLAATRQFDGAIDEFTRLATNKSFAESDQILWKRATEKALTLSVRVKKDPDQVLALINQVSALPSPVFLREYLSSWKDAAVKWKYEKPVKNRKPDALLAEAKRLFKAGTAQQKYPMDHSGDIYFLRTTAILHEFLNLAPNDSNTGEALGLMGQAYEILNDPSIYPIHEMYYESCIRQAPKTTAAANCYHRYEESVYFGYSGSGGTSIPQEVKRELNELKGMATPTKWTRGVPKGLFEK